MAFLTLYTLGAWGSESGNIPKVRAITKGQPPDVAALIERIVECNHWGGEEPYDKARTAKIKNALDQAGCGRLEADEQGLLKKYPANENVTRAIANAKNLVM